MREMVPGNQSNTWKPDIVSLVRARPFLLLLFIVALGCALRIYRLNARSLWLDEALSVASASRSISGILADTIDPNPPLYFLLLHVWTSFFGTSEQTLRFLSIVFGSLAIAFTGLLGFSLYDRRTGLFAALLMAMMVFPLHYAREVRPYSLFLALALGSFYFCLKSLQGGKRRHWVGYVFFTVAIGYTHNYWVFNVLAQNLYALLFYRTERSVLLRWIGAQAIVILCFFPRLLPLFKQTSAVMQGGFWIHQPGMFDLANTLRSYVAFLVRPQFLWGYMLLCVLGVLRITTVEGSWRSGAVRQSLESYRWQLHLDTPERSIFLLLWLACPIFVPFLLSQLFTPIFFPRYTIGAIPALYLLLARGVWQVPTILLRGLVISAIALVSVASLQHYYAGSLQEGKSKARYYFFYPAEPWREWVAFLAKRVEPTDVIIISPQWAVPAFKYYAKDSLAHYGLPAVLDRENRAKVIASLDKVTRGKRRLWLVFRWDSAIISGINGQSIAAFLRDRYQQMAVNAPVKPSRAPSLLLFDLTTSAQLASGGSEPSSEGKE